MNIWLKFLSPKERYVRTNLNQLLSLLVRDNRDSSKKGGLDAPECGGGRS